MKTVTALALALALAGCVQTAVPVPPPAAPVVVPVNKVALAVKRACGIALTAKSLSFIVKRISPEAADLAAYVTEICTALGNGAYTSGTFRGGRIERE